MKQKFTPQTKIEGNIKVEFFYEPRELNNEYLKEVSFQEELTNGHSCFIPLSAIGKLGLHKLYQSLNGRGFSLPSEEEFSSQLKEILREYRLMEWYKILDRLEIIA
jgi:hypothetical protein